MTPRPRTLPEWLAHIERQHPVSIDMGLVRVRAVATRLDLPRPARQVITVAGTNGKGSTVAFIEAIARAAGWRVGAYTSPHLLRYNERVRIDGRDAADDALVEAFEAVEAARGDTTLTYFEYGTLAALWLFARADLDLAVLEVGLGGRLDATNLVDADVAVVTTVDLDHQAFLGDDREAIGREKAGIMRAQRPVVMGEDDPPASVLRHAYALGAPAIRANCDFFFEPLAPGTRTDARDWRWREPGFQAVLPRPWLDAPAQRRNAATAIAALRALGRRLPKDALATGVAGARVAGRLQRLSRGGVDVVLDVGHNPQAARELAAWSRASPADGPTLAVFAALADKDVAGVAGAMAPHVDAWHLAGLDVGGRGQSADALATRLHGTAAADGTRHASVAAALEAALHAAGAGGRVLVFGSFHTVADALLALGGDTPSS
ncbi:bifunctional tetrahydrofolate synthase/dihydrofolate synthase [Luteimonas pelagia]